jgi:hypothetical protein
MNMIDLTGNRYGRLVVIGLDRVENKKTYWKCACDCGLAVVAVGNNLRSGNTSSCGCLRRETAKARGYENTKHGESHSNITRLYSIWAGMRRRCNSPRSDAYVWYGSKGVKVCEEWGEYQNFREWAMSHGYADNLTIDRIDPSKDYCPENCRWITRSENTARANKNHTTRKLIRGEGPRERRPAATHSGTTRTVMSHQEAEAL